MKEIKTSKNEFVYEPVLKDIKREKAEQKRRQEEYWGDKDVEVHL